MRLSIVTTLYRSAPYLREFHARCCAAAQEITPDFEFVLVNDGSPDESLTVAVELYEADPRVRVIDLSRNFGHHKAMMTGLAHARGDLVFLIDCDLEVAPETLGTFHNRLQTSRADVVYGVQEARQGPVLDRIFAQLFYIIFNALSSTSLPKNLLTTRLMTRRYVSALAAHQEREVLIGGLWAITGFKQEPILVDKAFKGHSHYNLGRKMGLIVNAVTSFSNRPLVLISYMGGGISALAGLAALYLVFKRLFLGVLLEGWPSLIVSVWLLGGLTIFSLGIIGIYLSKMYIEVKQRPYTIIRAIYEHSRGDHAVR